MPTPTVRNSATNVSVTAANAVANNAYANSADKLRVQQSALTVAGALIADFRLTGVTFAAAPVTGSLQLVIVDRDAAGTQGPAPVSTLIPGRVYTLGPLPNTSNASTGWIMGVNNIPLSPDQDVWLFNNGTGQSLNSGWTLTAMPWTPGQ